MGGDVRVGEDLGEVVNGGLAGIVAFTSVVVVVFVVVVAVLVAEGMSLVFRSTTPVLL